MRDIKSILFVGHEASLSGAPFVLLRFMEWFKKTVGSRSRCLLIKGGELEAEFATICPTSNLDTAFWRATSLKRRLMAMAKLSIVGERMFERTVLHDQACQFDLIYCNTVIALRVFRQIPRLRGRLICHVHELECVLRWALGDEGTRQALSRVDRFIACSQSVADNLIKQHKISSERIDVVHEFVPLTHGEEHDVATNRIWLREELHLRPETLIVGASGTYGWRKGTDLFVQIAKLVTQIQPSLDVHFLWLGGTLEHFQGIEFIRDIELSGMEKYVSVISSQRNPLKYFAGLDLFALTSREDPYPLVCLEAASCGVPLVCFEHSGGIPEFIEADSGAVVPYLDVNAFATKVIELLEARSLRKQFGLNARQKVRTRHNIDVAGPMIFSSMKQALMDATPHAS